MKYITKETCRLFPAAEGKGFEETVNDKTDEQMRQAFDSMRTRLQKAGNEYTYYYVMISQNIPEHIRKNYGFHDRQVLCAEMSGADFVLTLSDDSDQSFNRVIYKNAEVLQNENVIGCTWLYDEIIISADGDFEYHAILEGEREDYRYLTVKAKDMEFI